MSVITSLWGMHWLRYHAEAADWQHIAAMNYGAVKCFEWMWADAGFCGQLRAAAPNALYVARDYPLSEQKAGLATDPAGLGRYHADQWAEKVQHGVYKLPAARSLFLGVNEPPVWDHLDATVVYTVAYLRRMHEHGLHAGALSLSVGWPGTSPQSNGLPDWTPYAPVRAALAEGDVLVLHEYGTFASHGWGYWCDRLRHCPWSCPIIVGECGIDEAVAGGGHKGWQQVCSGDDYLRWLDAYHAQMSADPRVISLMPFTYDFSHPWGSFDIRPIRQKMEGYPWTQAPTPNPPQPIPAGGLLWPCAGPITQRFGEGGPQFGMPGHNGTDIGAALGAPVLSPAAGEVMMVDVDPDYGNYVRVYHPAYGFHSFHAHLSAASVAQGAQVGRGQELGKVGSTGNSTGPHLHYEIRLGSRDAYAEGQYGYSKGRVDPQTVYDVLRRHGAKGMER